MMIEFYGLILLKDSVNPIVAFYETLFLDTIAIAKKGKALKA